MQFNRIIIIITLIFIGCIPSGKIKNDFKDPGFYFNQIQPQSRIKVIVTEHINLLAFKNTFVKEYQSNKQFSIKLAWQISDSIKSNLLCNTNVNSYSQNASLFNPDNLNQSDTQQMQQLFEASNEDYFFVVKSVDISSKMGTNSSIVMANQQGGSIIPVNGGSSKTCVVNIYVEIWNVKDKKKLLSYTSNGDAKVMMIGYGTTLKKAIGKSIKYAINYLITGRTK